MASKVSLLKGFCVLSLFAHTLGCSGNPQKFESKEKESDAIKGVSEAVLTSSFEKNVKVKGRIASICPDDGCWIVISDNVNSLRVEFSDNFTDRFILSRDSDVIVEGILEQKIIQKFSPGFDAYQKSCAMFGDSLKNLSRITVLTAQSAILVNGL